MRADLEILEKVDHYLSGNMSGADKIAFEQQMSIDPGLKSMVNDQQLLIKTINRQAIMADINAVVSAGGTAWYSNITTWLVSGLIVSGLIVGLVVYNWDDATPEEIAQVVEVSDETEPNEVAPLIIEANADVVEAENPIHEVVQRVSTSSNIKKVNQPKVSPPMVSPGDSVDNKFVAFEVVEAPAIEEVETTAKIERNRRASFPGGELPMKRYFDKNLKFPGTAKKKGIEGNVKVNFFVYADGRVETTKVECVNLKAGDEKPFSSFKIMFNHKVKKLFEREAERLFRLMPTWESATDSNGNPVLAPMEMWIDFDMYGNSSAYDLDFDHSEGEYKTIEAQ